MKNTFKIFELNDCTLQNTRIDIWQYPLHTEFSEAAQLLNYEESARAKRYYFARHQRRFTVARAMLRLILGKYITVPAQKLIFTQNHYGKPTLESPTNIQFNLSHSGEMALLAVGQQYPLGVDLEFFAARPYEGIGQHMFSSKESNALNRMSRTLQPLSFFNIWAQKEALIKACGLGLSYPTQQFDVPALPGAGQKIHDTLHDKEWQMVSFMPHIACCAALCHHSQINEIRYIALEDLTFIKRELNAV